MPEYLLKIGNDGPIDPPDFVRTFGPMCGGMHLKGSGWGLEYYIAKCEKPLPQEYLLGLKVNGISIEATFNNLK